MILRGVKFGTYHTAGDWGLTLNEKVIEPPTPKIVTIPIDGRDGSLDLSEALTGEIKYENRKLSFTFILTEGTYRDRNGIIRIMYSVIHGRRLEIVLDDDTLHYFVGRCMITSTTNTLAYGTVTIEVECEPFQYSIYETVRTIIADATLTDYFLVNQGVKTLVPTLKVTGAVRIVYGSTSVSLSDGEYKIPSLKLPTGETLIQVDGSGTLVVTYREGVL